MRCTLVLLALSWLASWSAAGDNWSQFRGPNGTGHADAAPPLRWSETENVVWKTAIPGKAWSSPVVWGDQVWLTTAPAAGHEFFAVCVDRASGKVVHHLKLFECAKPDYCIPFNSYASPTPVIEAGRVYVHFGTYGTACLDTATGKVLWKRDDLHCDHFRGPGSSPILFGNLLFVHFDGVDRQFVVALDKTTGKTVWQKDRSIDYRTTNPDLKKAYGTPSIVEVNGKPQLVSSAAAATIAYDPATGEELWTVRHGGMNSAQPPLAGRGKVFLCTGSGGLGVVAVRTGGRGDVTDSHIVWKLTRGAPTRCSPVLIDDLLYLVNENGLAMCLDAETGKQIWQHRLNGQFSASPVYAGGRLYFCSQEGLTHVLEPGRTPKVVATNKLDEGFMASPAVAGNSLFLRTKTHLYRIEQK